MIPNIKPSLIKLLFLCASAIAIVLTFKYYVHQKTKGTNINSFDIIADKNSINCFFVGSSRIKYSINTESLNKKFNDATFYNLGISACTFNYGARIAEKVMGFKMDKKVIFFELSKITLRPPTTFQYTLSTKDLKKSSSFFFKNFFSLNYLQHNFSEFISTVDTYVFNLLSLKEDIQANKYPDYILKNIGYTKSIHEFQGGTDTFITMDEITANNESLNSAEEAYLKLIVELIQKASLSNTKIFFVLPINYRSISEKKEVLKIYNNISDANKILYSDSLFKKITFTTYLHDGIHLNSKGAAIYTQELSKEINERGLLEDL